MSNESRLILSVGSIVGDCDRIFLLF